MISHIKKFILISPPKTASVSLTDALKHVIDIKQIIPQIEGCYDYIESDNSLPAKHKTAEDYKKNITDLNKSLMNIQTEKKKLDNFPDLSNSLSSSVEDDFDE